MSNGYRGREARILLGDSGDGVATLDPTTGISYTSAYTYSMSGDQIAARTPPLTTTVNGTPRANTPSVTTSAYDGDGNEITSTSANGNTTTSAYDHLGRLVQTTAPRVPLFDGSSVAWNAFCDRNWRARCRARAAR